MRVSACHPVSTTVADTASKRKQNRAVRGVASSGRFRARQATIAVSKTGGWGFESLLSCQRRLAALALAPRGRPGGSVTFRLAAGLSILYEASWRGGGRPRAANFSAPLPRSGAAPAEPKTMANPFEFIQQVRSEAAKVVWPTRRETLVTTGMVLLMVAFTSLFFLVVDETLRIVVGLALGIGRGG